MNLCPACNRPLALTANVRIYRCECGQLYSLAPASTGRAAIDRANDLRAIDSGDNFDFVNVAPPRTVDDLKRL